MKQLFIIAQKRTGSTLLQRILNQIPGFLISGENGGAFLHLAKFYHQIMLIPSKEVAIDFYEEGVSEMKPSWMNPWMKKTDQICTRLREMMEEMYGREDATVWGFKEIRYGRFGESYEDFVVQLSFLRSLFPNCKFIFLTREMESLIASNLKHPPRGKPLSSEVLSGFVRLQFSHFKKYQQANPGETFLLSFEDIVSQKALFKDEMFKFLEVPFKEEYLKPLQKNL